MKGQWMNRGLERMIVFSYDAIQKTKHGKWFALGHVMMI